MTISLTETGTMTAAVLELARVARAITCTRERIEQSKKEIAATKTRLTEHLKRFRGGLRAQKRRLLAQQKELRRQMARAKSSPSPRLRGEGRGEVS
jgi:uncharacterized protein involved in exopolysaccharide biosynthesis